MAKAKRKKNGIEQDEVLFDSDVATEEKADEKTEETPQKDTIDAIDDPVTAAKTAFAPTVAIPIPPVMRRKP